MSQQPSHIFYSTLALISAFALLLIFIVYIFAIMNASMTMNKDHVHSCPFISRNDFDVYLINLSKNADRLSNFMTQFSKSDLASTPFYRFEAVNGREIDLQDHVSKRAYEEIISSESSGYRLRHYQLTRGGVGCYLSHQDLLQQISHGQKKYGIIFEDDVTIDPRIYSKMINKMHEIPNEWDVLLLGCYCYRCEKKKVYSDAKRFFLLHGYVVTKEGAHKISQYLSNIKIEQQIDTVLSIMAEQNLIKIYCLNAPLAKQDALFDTTIQIPIKKTRDIDPWESIEHA